MFNGIMYPPQSSFYAVVVSLARLIETQGWPVAGESYPYWYLGTTPFKYLTGPVVPGLMVWGHQLLPGLNLFEILFGLGLMFWLIGIGGLYWWLRSLKSGKRAAGFAALVYGFGLILPWLWPVSDGGYLIAFSLLPWVLGLYGKWLKEISQKRTVLLCISIAFVILTNSLILPSLGLGMTAMLLTISGWKKAEDKLKKSLGLVLGGVLIATIWYSPGYWWQLLRAPSFSGKPALAVIGQLAKLLPIAVGLMAAGMAAKLIKGRDRQQKLGIYWLMLFGWLSFFRFIADPDFWLDWTAYGLELQLGLGILIGWWLAQWEGKKRAIKYILIGLLIVSWGLVADKRVIKQWRRSIAKTVEYKIGQELVSLVQPEETVFLSGSTVFWLNSLTDVRQVRGGVDQAAVDQNWRAAAWEVREGSDGNLAINKLKELKVKWLVVHTSESEEFYHDFKQVNKFEKMKNLVKVYDQSGDRIYRLE